MEEEETVANLMNKWETVTKDDEFYDVTERMGVPGGWLVRTHLGTCDEDGVTQGVALAFVPHPDGWGDLEPKYKKGWK